MKVRARVFDKDGDRFLIPGFWYSDDDPELGLGSQVSVLTEALMVTCVLGAKNEEWVEIVTDEGGQGGILHLPMRFVGRQFAQGAVDVLLISGPRFDAELKAMGGEA